MNNGWSFGDPKNIAVFTTNSIIEGKLPILLVFHDDDDGAWQFLDGNTADYNLAAVVALEEIVKLDPTIVQLADLPLGWQASRLNSSEPWQRSLKQLP